MGLHGDHRPDLGQPSGIATLDGDALLPESQLPASVQALLGSAQEGEFTGLGTRLDYLGQVLPADSEIQAIKTYLPKGDYDRMRFYVHNGGGGSTKQVRLGVYFDNAGVPGTQVEQTAAYTINGLDDTMVTTALESPFTLGAGGIYWLAIVVSGVQGTSPKLAGTPNSAPPGFLNELNFTTTGTTLPSPLTGGASTGGAVLFRALIQTGAA